MTRKAKSNAEALRAFDNYRAFRLAEAQNPAIMRDAAWRQRVGWAFALFCTAFERLER